MLLIGKNYEKIIIINYNTLLLLFLIRNHLRSI